MHNILLNYAEQTKGGVLVKEYSIFGIIAIDSSFKNKKLEILANLNKNGKLKNLYLAGNDNIIN